MNWCQVAFCVFLKNVFEGFICIKQIHNSNHLWAHRNAVPGNPAILFEQGLGDSGRERKILFNRRKRSIERGAIRAAICCE